MIKAVNACRTSILQVHPVHETRQGLPCRWQGAAATLINSAAMVKDINTLSDRFNKPSDR